MPASPDLSFETPRIRARLLCEDDLDLYLALYTDPEVMRYIGPVLGREEVERQFRKAIALNSDNGARIRFWAGCSLEGASGAPLGLLSAVWNMPARAVEIGVMLLGSVRLRGYGSALLHGLIEHVLADTAADVDVVIAKHLSSNVAAEKLFASLGFSTSMNEDPCVRVCVLTPQQWLGSPRPLPLVSMSF